MITDGDAIRVKLCKAEIEYCKQEAEKAMIGGRSHVRPSDEREENLRNDQIAGQVATYAGHKAMFGHSFLYRLSRHYANMYPTTGDGGSDVPGANIDFKGTMLRYQMPLVEYHLPVRPSERHKNVVYSLVLVEMECTMAYIMGWARESELPPTVDRDGPLAGAFTIKAAKLNPMMPIRWFGAA